MQRISSTLLPLTHISLASWQTVQNQIRHHKTRRLSRFSIVCLNPCHTKAPSSQYPKKIAERRGARSTNASITAATQWHRSGDAVDTVGSHRTPSDGVHFEHTKNKHRHSAFTRPLNRAQRGRRKVTIAAQ